MHQYDHTLCNSASPFAFIIIVIQLENSVDINQTINFFITYYKSFNPSL